MKEKLILTAEDLASHFCVGQVERFRKHFPSGESIKLKSFRSLKS
jgi:hypothetical protein